MATQKIKTFNPNDRFKNFGIGKSRKSAPAQQYSVGGFRSKYQSPNIESAPGSWNPLSSVQNITGGGGPLAMSNQAVKTPNWYSNIGGKANIAMSEASGSNYNPYNPSYFGQGSTRVAARNGGYASPYGEEGGLGFKLLPKHIQEQIIARKKAEKEAAKQNKELVAAHDKSKNSERGTGTTNIARDGGFKGGTGSNFLGSKSKYQAPTVPYAQQPVPNVQQILYKKHLIKPLYKDKLKK